MIRDLTKEDIPHLLVIGMEMHVESVYKDYPLNEERTAFIFADLIDSDIVCSKGVMVDGKLVGLFFGEVSTDLWVDVDVARDIVLYLLPDHRGGGHGVRLMKTFEKWAKDKADVVLISVFAGIDNEKMYGLLNRMGYDDAGSLHLRSAA